MGIYRICRFRLRLRNAAFSTIVFPAVLSVLLLVGRTTRSESFSGNLSGVGRQDTIPDVFTPGDRNGIGDTWQIPGALSSPGNHLRIFNRWGTLVKDVRGYRNDWDGDNLPAGIYYYTYHDGKKTVAGSVTILR